MNEVRLYRRETTGHLVRLGMDPLSLDQPKDMMERAAKAELAARADADLVRIVRGEQVIFEWPTPTNT